MPRDFKTFAKNKEKVENILNENQEKVNVYQDVLNKYKNMDQNELMSNLFSEATKLKKDGKLNNDTLNNLKTTLAPFLNSDQQNMLNDLVNKINEQK